MDYFYPLYKASERGAEGLKKAGDDEGKSRG
jgi:hypothetical protein